MLLVFGSSNDAQIIAFDIESSAMDINCHVSCVRCIVPIPLVICLSANKTVNEESPT